MRTLYPEFDVFDSFQLEVSASHSIYVEQAGNPKGTPVIFVHGGPGGGIESKHRRYFNPNKWRIILFDQRGCGKSEPFGSLEENTTWDLILDMEKIRQKLNIAQWHVFGGSWGSTLSLAYAEMHPENVLSLVLRGIFLLRKKEIRWFYQYGASEIFPEAWESFLSPIPTSEHSDLLSAYHKRLTCDNKETIQKAAKAWSQWEGSTSRLIPDAELVNHFGGDDFSYAFARIECHYFKNQGFFESDGWLLDNASKIKDIPTVIVQGRYDMPCPTRSAFDLHRVLPKSKLVIVPDAGHSGSEKGITDALVTATDNMSVC